MNPTRYTETRNSSGLGFSNGLSPDENGNFIGWDDYKRLLDAYTAICEDLTAAQGQIADAQSSIDKVEKMKRSFAAIQEAAELRDFAACYEIARKEVCNVVAA
jgi:hypothetical protein